MAISSDQRFRVSSRAIAQEVGGETVIMDLGSEQYFGLNKTGTRIWELVEREASVSEIVEALVGVFDIPRARLEADSDRLLTELSAAGLIVPLEPS